MTTTMTRAPAGPGAGTVTLTSVDELLAARDRHVGLRHRQVVLDLPGLTAEDRVTTARRMTELLDECGCDTGARAMVAGFALVLGVVAAATGGRLLPTLALSPLAVLGAVVGAGAGKAYGLARSRRQFRAEIDELIGRGV